jgi:hypothetical protein
MDIHSVTSTVVITVTVSGMVPSLLQNFTIWTYYLRTLVKRSIQFTMCASIYEKQLQTQETKYWSGYTASCKWYANMATDGRTCYMYHSNYFHVRSSSWLVWELFRNSYGRKAHNITNCLQFYVSSNKHPRRKSSLQQNTRKRSRSPKLRCHVRTHSEFA